jgi:peptidoglycan DL-endopeptidase CwlO
MKVSTLAFAVCCLAAAGLAGCAPSQPAPPPAAAAAPPPAPAPAPQPPPPPAIPPNLTPAQQRVAKIQVALNSNGAQLDVDGKWGPKTSAALKAFQEQHHLRPTGRMNAPTAKALGL